MSSRGNKTMAPEKEEAGSHVQIATSLKVLAGVASIVIPVMLAVFSWTANKAYDAFVEQGKQLVIMSNTLATLVAQRAASDESLTQAWSEINKQAAELNDHERRISRVEAVSSLAPLLKKGN